jgi:hypothetical protein
LARNDPAAPAEPLVDHPPERDHQLLPPLKGIFLAGNEIRSTPEGNRWLAAMGPGTRARWGDGHLNAP